MKSATRFPCRLGGGIRGLDTIGRCLDDGVSCSSSVRPPSRTWFPCDACSAFAGHIIVGLDAKDGKVAVDGWSKMTGHDVIDLAKKFEDYGVEGVIYTDIGRDGMLSGVNIEATVKLAQALRIPVIASGGITNLLVISMRCAVEEEGIYGVTRHEGQRDLRCLDFRVAQARADELNGESLNSFPQLLLQELTGP